MSGKGESSKDFESSVPIHLEDKKSEVLRENTRHELSVKACPVKNVTVFADKAEVSRLVEAQIAQGDVEILVKELPALIDQNSVRYARVICYLLF